MIHHRYIGNVRIKPCYKTGTQKHTNRVPSQYITMAGVDVSAQYSRQARRALRPTDSGRDRTRHSITLMNDLLALMNDLLVYHGKMRPFWLKSGRYQDVGISTYWHKSGQLEKIRGELRPSRGLNRRSHITSNSGKIGTSRQHLGASI